MKWSIGFENAGTRKKYKGKYKNFLNRIYAAVKNLSQK